MDLLSIFGIALGLSMDAFAVSITNGVLIKNMKFHQGVLIAISFGFFQSLMPIIGWLTARFISGYLSRFSHWIAFILLAIIGIKMIWESRQLENDEVTNDRWNCLNPVTLFTLSIATSIDALAVGVSFGVLNSKIVLPVIIIGLVTFFICLIGVNLGKKIGHLFEKKIEVFGGVVLILIGIKILIEGILKNY